MIPPVGSLNALGAVGPSAATGMSVTMPLTDANRAADFQQLLLRSLDQVSQLDHQAQSAIESSLTDANVTQAEAMIAFKKADLALRTMMQIRNKVLDAYQEVQQMRM